MGDDDIVGHKTFATGRTDPETGFPESRHEPLTRGEADKILAAIDEADKARALTIPDEGSAINAMFQAWLRLKELGWGEACYCPKDGSPFYVIEPGSTGIHTATYQGKWPKGSWWVEDGGDLWPSHPVLFKLLPDSASPVREPVRTVNVPE